MNNEQLRTQILTYRPTSVTAAPTAAHYSLFTIHYSLNFSFSAKERDTETGLSYFGARYYSSDLSVWLSVDPMSGKYPSLSPYVYCADNPVKLVDPNGEDWFENELTGDIYYSISYKKGDEKHIEGEGWKWMGENGMFEKSDQAVLMENWKLLDFSTLEYGRAKLCGKNAKEFMSEMGYKCVPTQVVTYDNTYSYSMSDGKHSFRFTLGGKYDYTEKTSYVPKSYSESGRKQIGNAVYGKGDPMSGQIPTVSRNVISYSESRNYAGVVKFLYAMGGHHDYTNNVNCGRLSSAKLTGNQGALINKFLRR